MIRKLWLLCVMGLLLTNGCVFPWSRTSLTPTSRSAWLTKFLENPSCQPPCWENITPNVTSIDEAKGILAGNPDIQITETYPEAIEWNFIPDIDSGFVESENDKRIVDLILLGVSEKQSLKLCEVIDNYPQPTHIDFGQNMHNLRTCYLRIFFEPRDMQVSNGILPCNGFKKDGKFILHIEITPDTVIGDIFMVSDLRSRYKLDGLSHWNGYGEYIKEFER